ncbi:MAG: cytochrome b5 domain-containing protein [Clostridia bacterium]
MKGFTLEELKEFDGKDGRAMYVAINGVVYDLTGVLAWSTGQHNGNQPGEDLSEAIKSAPHGVSVLENLKIVGKLTE